LKSTLRTHQKLIKDLAVYEAERFNAMPVKPKYYSLHQTNGLEGDFINVFIKHVKEHEQTLLFLTIGDETFRGQLLVQGPPGPGHLDIVELGQQICERLDGKGNGKNNKFQGKVNNLKNIKECEELIKDYYNVEE
jgi:misacylated tRNA(Ala) deacylase